jgi:hypothetical protein
MDGPATDGLHALDKENSSEATASDLVGDVPVIVLDTDCSQLVS